MSSEWEFEFRRARAEVERLRAENVRLRSERDRLAAHAFEHAPEICDQAAAWQLVGVMVLGPIPDETLAQILAEHDEAKRQP